MYLYSIKDVKSGKFAPPFISENDESATRSIIVSLQTQDSNMLKMFPEDYVIYNLGNFDEDTGWIEHKDLVRVSAVAELLPKFYKDDVNDKIFKIDSITGEKSK